MTSREDLYRLLEEVKDPEIPVISIVDLGIVRDVRFEGRSLVVDITPTYSGCPAIKAIEEEVVEHLHRHGYEDVRVKLVYNPPWTTDWISDKGRENMRAFGIAPPGAAPTDPLVQISMMGKRAEPIACPYCGSKATELRSQFGPTACKALHYCSGCRQPFEHFKPF